MYGTIYRLRPKAGKEADVIRIMDEWDRERRPKVKGSIAGYLFKLDKGGMMGVALFESKEAYVANANDPEQDAWYRQFRALMVADPQWFDGKLERESTA